MRSVSASFQSLSGDANLSLRVVAFVLLMLACILLDIEHLIFTIFGAGLYAALQFHMPNGNVTSSVNHRSNRKQDPPIPKLQPKPKLKLDLDDCSGPVRSSYPHGPINPNQPKAKAKQNVNLMVSKPVKPPVATQSAQPISAPTFQSQGWDNEVAELVTRLVPKEDGQRVVTKIASEARKAIQGLLPEAQLSAFACGDPTERASFGVAVPEVELVLQCPAQTLFMRLQSRLEKKGVGPNGEKINYYKLRKSAVRACTDMLVNGGFKFRRSAFRGVDPKVTLLVPPEVCGGDSSIPVDLSVNNATPLRNAALMAAAAVLDSRALELALLVKRWAKDRGISHAAKGMFLPYAWNILTIFFLQARTDVASLETVGMLPPLDQFDWSNVPKGLKPPPDCSKTQQERWTAPEEHAECEVPTLLKEFFIFYSSTIDWETEAVSLHAAQRGPIPKGVEIQEVLEDEAEGSLTPEYGLGIYGKKMKVLTVVDPWEPQQNLAAEVTHFGVCRMKEELRRAVEISGGDASLSDLLEPWIPPEPAS